MSESEFPFKDRFDELADKLDRLEESFQRLVELLTMNPEGTGGSRPTATPAQLHHGLYVSRAKQMRQGKAAKRLGLSREEFVSRYGNIDYIPASAQQKRTPRKASKRPSLSLFEKGPADGDA